MATLPEGRRSSDGIQTLSVFSIGDTVLHIGYADRLVEVICQEQHLLKTDLFEGVNVQSVACVCVCVRVCGHLESSVVCSVTTVAWQLLSSFN